MGVLRTARGGEPLHTEYFMFGIFFAPGSALNEVFFKTGLWKMQVDLFCKKIVLNFHISFNKIEGIN